MWYLVWEALYMGAFIFAISYGVHYVAFKKGLADDDDIVKTQALKKRSKHKKHRYETGNLVIDKWLEFGGGYYGIVALVRLIFIELGQIRDFIVGFPGLDEFIEQLGLGTLIGFFIEQFMNFIAAVTWPVDYLGRYSIWECAVFVLITYLAYEQARKLARAELRKSESLL